MSKGNKGFLGLNRLKIARFWLAILIGSLLMGVSGCSSQSESSTKNISVVSIQRQGLQLQQPPR